MLTVIPDHNFCQEFGFFGLNNLSYVFLFAPSLYHWRLSSLSSCRGDGVMQTLVPCRRAGSLRRGGNLRAGSGPRSSTRPPLRLRLFCCHFAHVSAQFRNISEKREKHQKNKEKKGRTISAQIGNLFPKNTLKRVILDAYNHKKREN